MTQFDPLHGVTCAGKSDSASEVIGGRWLNSYIIDTYNDYDRMARELLVSKKETT